MPTPSRTVVPNVVIVGRPNVGKSALFNRIARRRIAIVHEQPGVTRDRVTAVADWFGKPFRLVDTGGLNLFRGHKHVADIFDAKIREQLEEAIAEADSIIFVVDVQSGLMALDREVAAWLREIAKPVFIAANKADNAILRNDTAEFAELGGADIFPTSCSHNSGIGDLLDSVTESFAEADLTAEAAQRINIAIVGRPNVGKSSTVNRILGAERVIVSEVSGTTRDAVDVPLELDIAGVQIKLNLIDTAGIKRRGKTNTAVDVFSLDRTRTAIRRADVVLIILDAEEPGTAQDKRICRLVLDEGKPCVLLANKWDIACQELKQQELFEKIAHELPFLDYAPIMTCCALSGYNFKQILPTVVNIYQQMDITIPTPLVNRVIQDLVERTPPHAGGGTRLKIFYGVYKSQRPPTFMLFVNHVKSCRGNYIAFLKNQFRRAFGLDGLPVFIEMRERKSPGRSSKFGKKSERAVSD
jgi:GTP-binding protein